MLYVLSMGLVNYIDIPTKLPSSQAIKSHAGKAKCYSLNPKRGPWMKQCNLWCEKSLTISHKKHRTPPIPTKKKEWRHGEKWVPQRKQETEKNRNKVKIKKIN